VIIAELGVDMGRFPTPGHLASWAKFAPGVSQSAGKPKGKHTTGHGNPYLARVLGEAAAAAGKTNTFLGERYRRIVRRRGAKRAIVAVGRSILIIVWHLLADPTVRFHDLGPDFYGTRIDTERRKRNHVRQLEALGYKVTLQPAAQPASIDPAWTRLCRVLPPARPPLILGLGRASALSTRTGAWAVRGSAWRRRKTSWPGMSGMCRSSRTRSGWCSAASSSPSWSRMAEISRTPASC
jgi:hypothetical protein